MEAEVPKSLECIEEVEAYRTVFGEYDIIVKITTESLSTMIAMIIERIRSIEGVASTTTLIVAENSD